MEKNKDPSSCHTGKVEVVSDDLEDVQKEDWIRGEAIHTHKRRPVG